MELLFLKEPSPERSEPQEIPTHYDPLLIRTIELKNNIADKISHFDSYTAAKKLFPYASHFIFPLMGGALINPIGGGLGIIIENKNRQFAEKFTIKSGGMGFAIFLGILFCSAGAALGEWGAQKEFNSDKQIHFGAIAAIGLTTFLGGMAGYYAKGILDSFLFRTALNLSLTTLATCLDATIENKNITNSIYSKEFFISLGLAVLLGESFRFAVHKICGNKISPLEEITKQDSSLNQPVQPPVEIQPSIPLSKPPSSVSPTINITRISDLEINLKDFYPAGEENLVPELPALPHAVTKVVPVINLKRPRNLDQRVDSETTPIPTGEEVAVPSSPVSPPPSQTTIQDHSFYEDPFSELNDLIPSSRTFQAGSTQSRQQLDSRSPELEAIPSPIPEVKAGTPYELTGRITLNEALEPTERAPSSNSPTPQEISDEIIARILFRYHPEFNHEATLQDIQNLKIPQLINESFYDEEALMHLMALLYTPNLSGSRRNKIPIFTAEEMREIVIYLKSALEVFHPERAGWLNSILTRHWNGHLTLNEPVYVEAKKSLEKNRAIEIYSNHKLFTDLVKSIVEDAIKPIREP